MRIGIFGGSFDPIHLGHLIIAEQCRVASDLDQIWFVPCASSPHKPNGSHATDRQRKEMIELAIAGHDGFRLSTVELDRGGVSFTVDTLKTFADSYPEDDLYFLMGDDSLESFSSWREPETICELASILIMNRPGAGEVDLSTIRTYFREDSVQEVQQVECPLIDIASTDIRRRSKEQVSFRFLVPRSVERYIQTHKIYQPK